MWCEKRKKEDGCRNFIELSREGSQHFYSAGEKQKTKNKKEQRGKK
jgi:hypothetical protein